MLLINSHRSRIGRPVLGFLIGSSFCGLGPEWVDGDILHENVMKASRGSVESTPFRGPVLKSEALAWLAEHDLNGHPRLTRLFNETTGHANQKLHDMSLGPLCGDRPLTDCPGVKSIVAAQTKAWTRYVSGRLKDKVGGENIHELFIERLRSRMLRSGNDPTGVPSWDEIRQVALLSRCSSFDDDLIDAFSSALYETILPGEDPDPALRHFERCNTRRGTIQTWIKRWM